MAKDLFRDIVEQAIRYTIACRPLQQVPRYAVDEIMEVMKRNRLTVATEKDLKGSVASGSGSIND